MAVSRDWLLVALCIVAMASASLRKNPVGLMPCRRTFAASQPNAHSARVLLNVRGGNDEDASDIEEDEDEEEVDDDEDDDDDDFDFELDLGDSDFADQNFVGDWVKDYKNTPPFTKSYLTLCTIASLVGFLANGNRFPRLLSLDWQATLKKGQIWRPFTTFLNIGSLGPFYLLTIFFNWQYMSTLERMFHHEPYEFWFMVLFGMLTMVTLYPLLGMQAQLLGHNLGTYIVYIWSRYNEGLPVRLFAFDVVAEMLPWIFLLQTFLLEGEPPILDLLGILFGHLYYNWKASGVLRTPGFAVRWYKESTLLSGIRGRYEKISEEFGI